jgi:protein MpaA
MRDRPTMRVPGPQPCSSERAELTHGSPRGTRGGGRALRARPRLARGLTLLASLGVGLLAVAEAQAGVTRELIGRSVEGRPIYAYELGAPGGAAVLVVGCIDGNEPAGIAIAQRLERLSPPRGVDLWIVPILNPDGRAARTLGNAHGVDLNRNFPFAWKKLGGTGTFDSGPRALSEPESTAAYRLILRVKPQLSIWFHQHLAVVDDSQGSIALERRFARLVGLPAVPLTDYPGSAASWENHTLPGSTAFVVELPAGWLSPGQVARDAEAVLEVAAR